VTQTAADFASEEQQAQIESVSFQGHLASGSSSAARVDVDSLTTIDGQYGCRTWSGAYQLTRQAGT
jgi:heat shock protein HslJ